MLPTPGSLPTPAVEEEKGQGTDDGPAAQACAADTLETAALRYSMDKHALLWQRMPAASPPHTLQSQIPGLVTALHIGIDSNHLESSRITSNHPKPLGISSHHPKASKNYQQPSRSLHELAAAIQAPPRISSNHLEASWGSMFYSLCWMTPWSRPDRVKRCNPW